jgi:hypothetical protein
MGHIKNTNICSCVNVLPNYSGILDCADLTMAADIDALISLLGAVVGNNTDLVAALKLSLEDAIAV